MKYYSVLQAIATLSAWAHCTSFGCNMSRHTVYVHLKYKAYCEKIACTTSFHKSCDKFPLIVKNTFIRIHQKPWNCQPQPAFTSNYVALSTLSQLRELQRKKNTIIFVYCMTVVTWKLKCPSRLSEQQVQEAVLDSKYVKTRIRWWRYSLPRRAGMLHDIQYSALGHDLHCFFFHF